MSYFKKLYTFEDIDNISILDYGYFRDDLEYTIKILQNVGLLRSFVKCICSDDMYIMPRRDIKDGYQYRCNTCGKKSSIRKNSIFEMSKLPLWKIFLGIVVIVQHPNMTYDTIRDHLNISSNLAISELKTIVRDFMTLKLDEEKIKIGGEGKIVQIDETAISKRKYNVGRILKNQQYWMVGGIDDDGQCFLKITRFRNRGILENIIIENVEIGSTIWTDGWGGYNKLNDLGFSHGTVIHNRRFVSPEGIHTNRIESTWGAFKRKYRNATNKNPDNIDGYISDFLFRRKYKNKELSVLFKHIMNIFLI